MNLKRARKDVEAMAARCGELADAFALPDKQPRVVEAWEEICRIAEQCDHIEVLAKGEVEALAQRCQALAQRCTDLMNELNEAAEQWLSNDQQACAESICEGLCDAAQALDDLADKIQTLDVNAERFEAALRESREDEP